MLSRHATQFEWDMVAYWLYYNVHNGFFSASSLFSIQINVIWGSSGWFASEKINK